MHIELTLKNYRCSPDARPMRISLGGGPTAFIGVNNSGKSSLLKFFYEFRIVSALLMTIIIHAISSVMFPVGAEEFVKARPVLPGKQCKTAHQNNWTEQERWVWKEVCEG